MSLGTWRAALPSIRELRLASGLVLFAYALCHLVGLAGGLFLVEGVRAASRVTLAVWQTPPGVVILYGALALHAGLGVAAVAGRTFPGSPARRKAQAVLGLLIPLALLPHLADVSLGPLLHDTEDGFERVLAFYALEEPLAGGLQVALVVLVWTHGCLGLADWLRFRPLWRRARPLAAAFAVLVPTLAVVGFTNAGFELSAATRGAVPGPEAPAVRRLATGLVLGWLGVVVLAVGTAVARRGLARLRPGFVVRVPGRGTVGAASGATLLSALNDGAIPMSSLCGGRARCSTCRVEILPGSAAQPPPEPLEAETLGRVRAKGNVRLACQLRPVGELVVVPLVDVRRRPSVATGGTLVATREEDVVVAAFDLRNSTALVEGWLPYDVFHLLGAWQEIVRRRVGERGGTVVSVAGDGLMTLFPASPSAASTGRAAYEAAVAVQADLADLSTAMRRDLARPLAAGVGLHLGAGLIGREADTGALHFFGEPANVASRLQNATKRLGGTIVASTSTIDACGLPPPDRIGAVALHEDGEPIAVGIYDGRLRPAT